MSRGHCANCALCHCGIELDFTSLPSIVSHFVITHCVVSYIIVLYHIVSDSIVRWMLFPVIGYNRVISFATFDECQNRLPITIGSVLIQAMGTLFLKLTKTHRHCLSDNASLVPLQILPAQSQLDEWQNHCEFNCRQLSFEITNHHIKFKLGSFGSYMIMMMTQ